MHNGGDRASGMEYVKGKNKTEKAFLQKSPLEMVLKELLMI